MKNKIIDIDPESFLNCEESQRLFYFFGIVLSYCPFCNQRHPSQRVLRGFRNDEEETIDEAVVICKSCGKFENWGYTEKIPILRIVDNSSPEEGGSRVKVPLFTFSMSMDRLRENLGDCYNELVRAYNNGHQDLTEEITDLKTFIGAIFNVYDNNHEDFHDLSYLTKSLLTPKTNNTSPGEGGSE